MSAALDSTVSSEERGAVAAIPVASPGNSAVVNVQVSDTVTLRVPVAPTTTVAELSEEARTRAMMIGVAPSPGSIVAVADGSVLWANDVVMNVVSAGEVVGFKGVRDASKELAAAQLHLPLLSVAEPKVPSRTDVVGGASVGVGGYSVDKLVDPWVFKHATEGIIISEDGKCATCPAGVLNGAAATDPLMYADTAWYFEVEVISALPQADKFRYSFGEIGVALTLEDAAALGRTHTSFSFDNIVAAHNNTPACTPDFTYGRSPYHPTRIVGCVLDARKPSEANGLVQSPKIGWTQDTHTIGGLDLSAHPRVVWSLAACLPARAAVTIKSGEITFARSACEASFRCLLLTSRLCACLPHAFTFVLARTSRSKCHCTDAIRMCACRVFCSNYQGRELSGRGEYRFILEVRLGGASVAHLAFFQTVPCRCFFGSGNFSPVQTLDQCLQCNTQPIASCSTLNRSVPTCCDLSRQRCGDGE